MTERLLVIINSFRSQGTAFETLEDACEQLTTYELLFAVLCLIEEIVDKIKEGK
jgi:hypothetical protein